MNTDKTDFEQGAEQAMNLYTALSRIAREEGVPPQVIERLAGEERRADLKLLLDVAVAAFVDRHKTKFRCGPIVVQGEAHRQYRIMLPPDGLSEASEVASWAKGFKTRVTPNGLSLPNQAILDSFAQGTTCDVWVVARIKERDDGSEGKKGDVVFAFIRSIYVGGKIVKRTLHSRLPKGTPILFCIKEEKVHRNTSRYDPRPEELVELWQQDFPRHPAGQFRFKGQCDTFPAFDDLQKDYPGGVTPLFDGDGWEDFSLHTSEEAGVGRLDGKIFAFAVPKPKRDQRNLESLITHLRETRNELVPSGSRPATISEVYTLERVAGKLLRQHGKAVAALGSQIRRLGHKYVAIFGNSEAGWPNIEAQRTDELRFDGNILVPCVLLESP